MRVGVNFFGGVLLCVCLFVCLFVNDFVCVVVI